MGKRIIAVGGGKGGVGKSFVAVNLAVAIARSGSRVVVVDADLGGANLHTLFGIHRPKATVHDFVRGARCRVGRTRDDHSVPGVRVIGGTCEVLGSAELDDEERERLLDAITELKAEYVVIDVGAGSSGHNIDLFNLADTRLVVMSPELTSARNAYGFLKMALYRRLQCMVADHPDGPKVRERLGGEVFEQGSMKDRLSGFISMISKEEPNLEEALHHLVSKYRVRLVGNMLGVENDRHAVIGLRRMIEKFLLIRVDVAAASAPIARCVKRSTAVSR